MDRNYSSRQQECPKEGDDVFGEELAKVNLPTTIERFVVHPLDKESLRQETRFVVLFELFISLQCSDH